MKKVSIIILILFFFSNAANFLTFDSKYFIVANESKVKITNLDKGSTIEKTFKAKINDIEISNQTNFMSVRFETNNDNERFVIYDIENDSIYKGFLNETDEKTWSPKGTYTYLKHYEYFEIIKTSDLGMFLKNGSKVKENTVKIMGHPMGDIFQEEWLNDNNLVFSTGSDEATCYGLLDISENRIYLLTCSGIAIGSEADSANKAASKKESIISEKIKNTFLGKNNMICNKEFWDCIKKYTPNKK